MGQAKKFSSKWSTIASAFCFISLITSSGFANTYTLFESGQVRPLALSPDGRHLYAVNTPDSRLEIFRVKRRGLRHVGSVAVGLEPVAVAVRTNHEVWVVNHLSDSISIVNVGKRAAPRVVRTLWVGDEPRDIVFAGLKRSRAFITTAHRGQNSPIDPALTTPGVGRADVWVFDVHHLGSSVGGDALTIITLFTDTPRALAVSPDGATVYAAGFLTGNQTTALNEFLVQKAIENSDRIYPGPLVNHAGIAQPQVGLIVKYDGSHWVDELGQVWDDLVPFHLPDTDVFAIDAMTDPPVPISGADGQFSSVGTVLFNMIVNPASGAVYVSNTEAFNHVRFEGPGQFAGSTVRGHLHESRITILNGPGLARVAPRHLNKHIDYSQCCDAIPNDENTRSLASPQHMAITEDGSTLYVAGFGSSKVGIYDTAELESDRFVPSVDHQVVVSGGGPSGVVLDEARGHLYVMTRFDNGISTIDLATQAEIDHLRMPNPEPEHIVKGRPFLYDAALTSSHGDSSCSSCHVFSDFDGLAWDLGDPDFDELINPGPFQVPPEVGFFLLRGQAESPHFRPMKGPMTTQSLRGLANHGSMHWRGDRTGGNDEPNAQPDSGAFNEDLAFRKFNVAFVGLNGRDSELSPEQMQAFADFNLEVTYPPNPIRHLDNSLTPLQQIGHDFFLGETVSDTFFTCNGCHVLDPAGNGEFGVKHPGFFGTDGQFSFEGESQFFKIPHLRNMYQKVGMFGMVSLSEEEASSLPLGSARFLDLANSGFMGDQIRGFGFLHDGSVDTLFRFVSTVVFLPRAPGTIPSLDPRTPPELVPDPGNEGIPLTPEGDTIRRGLEAFMLAFDSNMAPIVGQQVTLSRHQRRGALARVQLLMARADRIECDLIAKGRAGVRERGYLYVGEGKFRPDQKHKRPLSFRRLRRLARLPRSEMTFTCVPPGSGVRMGIDRDEDGVLDGD